MKEQIIQAISEAITHLDCDIELNTSNIQVTRSKDPAHGDYASNIAMTLAKQAKTNPRELADKICAHLNDLPIFNKVEIAGPGFINFFVAADNQAQVLDTVLQQGDKFGTNELGKNKSIHIEFVSANPTGPLHVGHGRGAAYGASIANLYAANGYKVHREYYVNDAGRQMDILATSVWIRYLELCGAEYDFPSNGYQGDYVWDIAATAHRSDGEKYFVAPSEFINELPADEPAGGDKEKHIDALIDIAKKSLAKDGYDTFFNLATQTILDDIKDDLHLFGVDYDCWYSERSLFDSKKINSVIASLREKDYIYEKNGALWFASSKLGDEKDRVVVRDNGQPTYFASDIAYHAEKLSQNYTKVINIWGADHHGYIARVRAALTALGHDEKRLTVLLVQFANLFLGKEKLQMSTRSGEFVTLRTLRKEVGSDAARFFYVMRKSEQHLDFDLELATSKTNENPVYYVQYAHARICSILRKIENTEIDQIDISLLSQESEQALIKAIAQYPEVVVKACNKQAPHLIVNYLRELSQIFSSYYNATPILNDENTALQNTRLKLISCIKQVIANGLSLIDVNAPEQM